MQFSLSNKYIASNPCFALQTISQPKLSRGQRKKVFECLAKAFPKGLTLEELVKQCTDKDYKNTFRNPDTDIRKSILYHLNRIEAVKQC